MSSIQIASCGTLSGRISSPASSSSCSSSSCAISSVRYRCLSLRSGFTGPGMRRRIQASRQRHFAGLAVSCKAKDIREEEFEEFVLKAELPVLVDIWAEWCGPCKLVAPSVDWAAQNYAGKLEVYKMDHDKSPGIVEKYKPYGLPTLILFKDGEEVPGSRREGAITKAKLKDHLDKLLQI